MKENTVERLKLLQLREKELEGLRQELQEIHRDGFRWLLTTATQQPQTVHYQDLPNPGLVSVVIPAYNAAQFITRAVESVWTQNLTSHSLEIFICEDGSSDATYEIALELQKQSPIPLHVLTHPGRINRGVSATRNLGLRQANGAFIALLDADDAWLPERLKVQLNFFQKNPDVSCLCSLGYNREVGGELIEGWNGTTLAGDYRYAGPKTEIFQPPYTFEQLLTGSPIVNSTLLIRRDALALTGGYPEVMAHQGEDWLLTLKLSLQAPIALIQKPLIDYTVHADSYTHRYFVENLDYGVEVEVLCHLVHWMFLHPQYREQGQQVFRRYYPRFMAARNGAYRLYEEYYRHQNGTELGVESFKSELNQMYTELQQLREEVGQLRIYHQTYEGRLAKVKQLPGVVPTFRLLLKLKDFFS